MSKTFACKQHTLASCNQLCSLDGLKIPQDCWFHLEQYIHDHYEFWNKRKTTFVCLASCNKDFQIWIIKHLWKQWDKQEGNNRNNQHNRLLCHMYVVKIWVSHKACRQWRQNKSKGWHQIDMLVKWITLFGPHRS